MSRQPSVLKVAEVRGAPGWLLDGEPYVPVLAQAGGSGLCEVRAGKLWLKAGQRVRTPVPGNVGDRWTLACTLTCGCHQVTGGPHPMTGAGPFVLLEGRNAEGKLKRYSIVLLPGEVGLCAEHTQQVTPGPEYAIRHALAGSPGQPARLRLVKRGPALRLEADGAALGQWTDPDSGGPMTDVHQLVISSLACGGTVDELEVRDDSSGGSVVLHETFDDPTVVAARFIGDLRPTDALPASSFFTAGCAVYTVSEMVPQLSVAWKEDGGFDWSEFDGYLDKIAALDSTGRLHCRFFFDAPDWWARRNPDQMVAMCQASGAARVTPYVSLASESFWSQAQRAARDLVRHADQHPEGWRFVGVLLAHGGAGEWFMPSWGEDLYCDYSPVFLEGFRGWLKARYGTVQQLRAAWKSDTVDFASAALPTPAERLRGDFYDFYDPAKGLHRQDFCTYSGELVTRRIECLARAFKEASGGRLYTRTPAGYQPGSHWFRTHSGPHADFAGVLKCPWLDGVFMPIDYRWRGHGGVTGFDLPVESILRNGKTYIAELDIRTHHVESFLFGTTRDPWQTAQTIKRSLAAALCHASGAEFKDWAGGWFEDEQTIPVIRKLNQLAQESVRHDRTPAAQIAVVVNPRSTCHVRDYAWLYWSLNHQQMDMTYPRLGAPHDRIMVDDLVQERDRDYKLYIVQDCLFLTDAQRKLIRDTACVAGRTVLWLYAPGFVGERQLSLDAMSDLVGVRIRHRHTYSMHLFLSLCDRTHPYNRGMAVGSPMPTHDKLDPLFYVDDPTATILGWGGDVHSTLPAFVVKQMPGWTSVYCSVPALPETVIRNIAREAGVHIYSDAGDFVAANHWLLTVCAASDGRRTIRLPRRATVTDAMTGEVVARDVDHFDVTMRFGQTAVWKTE